MNTWSQDTYSRTFRYAALAHLGQKIPASEVSYIQHLSLVTMEVLAALPHAYRELDGDLAIQCAILHDIIEDTDATYAQIEAEFGADVADGVLALTKDKSLEKAAQMADSLARIQQQPHEVWMVKLADRISNLLPPPHHWDSQKRRYYYKEAQIILQQLQPASPFLAARLQQKIDDYPQYF